MKCTRYLRLFLSLVFFSVVAPNWSAAAPWTPVEWQDAGKLRHWVRDANGNFVDDLIEERGEQSDVIVDLNSCAGDPGSSKIVAYLNTLGDVTYVGKYLTFIVVAGIDPNDALLIAARPEVAMVELAEDGKWNWDIFQAAKVKSSAPYSNTLQSDFGWPTTLNGAGINIAIVDSGVNSTYDPAFQYGYDGLTDTEGNPAHCPATEACGDHGSYMAEVVFDSGDGIARGAGLIDVKVGGSAGPDGAAYVRALEKIYEKRDDWNIHVVSISAGFSGAADGNESYNKLLDLLSGVGIVVVASAGDNAADAPVTTPGAATRAIAVAAADMTNTVSRADDTAPFVRGPRASDGDSDALDELKPEVVFPTGEAIGTHQTPPLLRPPQVSRRWSSAITPNSRIVPTARQAA